MTPRQPDLSVVIPALNEAAHLPYLLQDLSWQKNIQFEVIVVDGGSTDTTVEQCREFSTNSTFKIKTIESQPGRAVQLNKGTAISSADNLLFLHADSRIRNGSLLSNAQKFLSRQRQHNNNQQLCGHFPLKFSSSPGSEDDYYFYESKTYLNKADCINGDQGFWISKEYFNQLGKFDESLPYMEDARLALKIGADNNWITLPGEIETSARRFETEGFTKRQILNSFLCNFNAMSEPGYFEIAGDIYKQQDKADRLRLRPFLKATHRYMYADGAKTALRRWYQTGAYIASNAWQLAFALDCIKNKKHGLAPNADEASALDFYDRHLARIADWPLIKLLTGIVTIVWFYSLFLLR
jgi:rSAM/selenodomain-associated transferase 2